LPTMIVRHCCSLLEATTIFFRLPYSMRILRRTPSTPRRSLHTSFSRAAATTPAGRLVGKMSRTSRLTGHLFPPPANLIESVREGGESAVLDSLDQTRRASYLHTSRRRQPCHCHSRSWPSARHSGLPSMGEQAHHLQPPQRGEQCIYWYLRRSDDVGSSLLLGGGIFLSLGSFGALRPPLNHGDLIQNRRNEVVYNFYYSLWQSGGRECWIGRLQPWRSRDATNRLREKSQWRAKPQSMGMFPKKRSAMNSRESWRAP
jgi:hypothetical protein